MISLFRRFLRQAGGQDLIEYGLLIGMITVAIVFSIKDTGGTVADLYADTVSVLSSGSGADDPEGQPGDPAPTGGNPGNGNPGNGNPNPGNPGNGNPGNGSPVGNPGNGDPGNGNPGGGSPGGGKGK